MQRWREAGRGRRRAVFALAALAHGVLVGAMWRAQLRHERAPAGGVVEATIWLPPAPAARVAPTPTPTPTPVPAPRVTRLRLRLRALAREDIRVDPRTIQAPLLESPPIAQAASAAAPPASAASWVDLSLTREQMRSIIAARKPTLAQMLAAPPKPSALARLGGDDAPYEERPLSGGETEVHVHGGCFRLVPTPRAQYDPFNHANERVTAACH
jgi:hypothetical protein